MQKPWSINRVEFQTFFLSEKNRFFFFRVLSEHLPVCVADEANHEVSLNPDGNGVTQHVISVINPF